MKKIFSNSIVAAFVLLASVSCDRKNNDLLPESDSIADDFLQFRTESDYDSALFHPKFAVNAPAGFVSLANTLAASNARTEAKDDTLPKELTRLLNKDGVMQVGNWVIKLNFKDKRVYVIGNDQKKKLYTKLIKEQKDKDIYVFSFDDEVFALLDEGVTVSPTFDPAKNGRVNFLCGGGLAEAEGDQIGFIPSKCTGPWVIWGSQPNTAVYDVGTDYDKYGVYFRLNAVIKGTIIPDQFGSFSNCLITNTFQAEIYWKSNCNNYDEGTWPSYPNSTYQFSLQDTGTNGYPGISKVYGQYWTIYARTRGLKCVKTLNFYFPESPQYWNRIESCRN